MSVAEPLKIAYQHVTRLITLWQPIKIGAGLRCCSEQIPACTLLFNDQDAWPKQINEAALICIKALHPLFINGHCAAIDAKNLEEIIIERLGFTLFVVRIFPIFTERFGAPPYFIPAQTHSVPAPLP